MKDNTKLCPKCQSEIPGKATMCPNCRSDLRPWWRRHPILTFLIAIPLLGGVIQGIQNSDPEYHQQQTQQEQQKIVEQQKNNEILSKLEVVSKKVYNSYGFEHLGVKIKNNTGKDIDGLELKASFKNNFGENIKEKISNEEYFRGIAQKLIKAGGTTELEWQLSLFDNATTIDDFAIYKVHFTDGTTVEVN